MKTIAYYISDYGYGHATRSIAVIRELLNLSDVKIIICQSFALDFIKKSLDSERIVFRNVKTDIGYILEKDSIFPDKEKLISTYKEFVSDWKQFIQQEQGFLRTNNIDLVVSDISPLPFEAADSLGITSVGVSNFTWYTAYQGLIAESELNVYKKAYQKIKYFFSLAGSQEHWNAETCHYGFFSREINLQEAEKIRKWIDPSCSKKIVFLGIGMKIDVGLEKLPIWNSPNCAFIVSSNVDVIRPNVFKIPVDDLESQNYIAASDLVISKAGWGMVGEAVCANVPLLILNRPSMKEDQNTIDYLKHRHLCETIDWEDFMNYQVDFSSIRERVGEPLYLQQNESRKIATDLLTIIY